MVDESFIVVFGGELDLRVRLDGTVKNTQIDRAIYNRGERGQGDAHHGGEREGKKEQREST